MESRARSPRLAAILVVSLVLVAGACAGATPTPTPAPASSQPPASTAPQGSIVPVPSKAADASATVTSAEVCADLAAFQASIATLKGLDMSTAGVPTVLQAVNGAITTGTSLVDSAKAAYGPEAQALATALSGLQAALTGVTGEGTLLDKAATVENAIDEVAAAFDALKAELTPGCPSPEPSGG
jgi:hypothetical protein